MLRLWPRLPFGNPFLREYPPPRVELGGVTCWLFQAPDPPRTCRRNIRAYHCNLSLGLLYAIQRSYCHNHKAAYSPQPRRLSYRFQPRFYLFLSFCPLLLFRSRIAALPFRLVLAIAGIHPLLSPAKGRDKAGLIFCEANRAKRIR